MIFNTKAYPIYPAAQLGGGFKIRGTVLGEDGNPKIALVTLLKETGDLPGNLAPPGYDQKGVIRSNALGQYEFKPLPGGRYTVISYDKTGEFDPVIKGGLTPETLE
jgi:hypothetical protein